MMHLQKVNFLLLEFPERLHELHPHAVPQWGKMNVQQMIEHMVDAVSNANGKISLPLVTPVDKLQLFRDFMLSDNDFRPDTKNPLMPEIPAPVHFEDIQKAIGKLRIELSDFVDFYKEIPEKKFLNPIFGELNYEEWTHLLNKHAHHHLRQFAMII